MVEGKAAEGAVVVESGASVRSAEVVATVALVESVATAAAG